MGPSARHGGHGAESWLLASIDGRRELVTVLVEELHVSDTEVVVVDRTDRETQRDDPPWVELPSVSHEVGQLRSASLSGVMTALAAPPVLSEPLSAASPSPEATISGDALSAPPTDGAPSVATPMSTTAAMLSFSSARGLRLVPEARDQITATQKVLAQELEGETTPHEHVLGLVHDPHAPLGKQPKHTVPNRYGLPDALVPLTHGSPLS